MGSLRPTKNGMDAIIVCTGSSQQEEYWQRRLQSLRGSLAKSDALTVVVHEDWAGGAGNGLGTLYAYKKAQEKAKKLFNADLFEMQKGGASIGLYHAAGKGQRLFPLCASEYSNKPAVKLPGNIQKNPSGTLSILEAVIKHSSFLAPFRKGRLSVYWGDQIFVPTKNCRYPSDSHIDIFAKIDELPTAAEWRSQGMEHYGLVAIGASGEAQLIDKCTFETAEELILNGKLRIDQGIGASLGSFSLSAPMTFALMDEFQIELEQKKDQWDSDPFIWMPSTLHQDTYVSAMEKKGYSYNLAVKHFKRIQAFKDRFKQIHPKDKFFGAVDVGKDCYWWDYGTLDAYVRNVMKLTSDDDEAREMLKFFSLTEGRSPGRHYGLNVDEHSCIFKSSVGAGTIQNSILIGVNAENITASNCILINTTLKSFAGDSCVLYNVLEPGKLSLSPRTVRADILIPPSHEVLKVYTRLGRDGKEDWRTRLPGNSYTYEELEALGAHIDLFKAEALARELKNRLLETLTVA